MRIMQKRDGRGFTLVEVIVVLVVVGVLAAILIPSMTGWIDKSQAKACMANRQSILQQFETADVFLASEGRTATLSGFLSKEGDYAAYADALDGLTCPGGGTYSVKGDSVYCSVHGDMEGRRTEGLIFVAGDTPEVTLGNAWASVNLKDFGSAIDSTAPDGIRTVPMQQWMAEQGIDLAAQNIQTWKLNKEGGYTMAYWSDQAITDVALGERVKVIRYNPITKYYTAGYLKVVLQKGENGGADYPILAAFSASNWQEAPGQDKTTKADYETTLNLFNTLPATK